MVTGNFMKSLNYLHVLGVAFSTAHMLDPLEFSRQSNPELSQAEVKPPYMDTVANCVKPANGNMHREQPLIPA